MKEVSVALLGLVMVGTAGQSSAQNDTEMPVVLPFSVIVEGQMSGIQSQRFEVVRDGSAFAALWSEHTVGMIPTPPPPVIDFAQSMVIGLFLGNRNTGGYRITTTAAEEYSSAIVIKVAVAVPGSGCVVSMALTQPHQLVTLARSDKVIAFETLVERQDCLAS